MAHFSDIDTKGIPNCINMCHTVSVLFFYLKSQHKSMSSKGIKEGESIIK